MLWIFNVNQNQFLDGINKVHEHQYYTTYNLLGSLHGGLEKGPSIECDVRHDPSFLLSFVEMT